VDAGYRLPKPLVDVAGRPISARLLEKFPRDWRFVSSARRAPAHDRAARNAASRGPDGEIVAVPGISSDPSTRF